MGKSIFDLTDKTGYESPWEEEITQQTTNPKITLKCKGTTNIRANCAVDIYFILDGSSGWTFGFDHVLTLSSNDQKLKIYDDTFEVDNGWTFIATIARETTGTSKLIVTTQNNFSTSFSFNFVNEKSVFNRGHKNTIVSENSDLVDNDSVCFRVADKALAKLLNDKTLILNSYADLSGFTRMDSYKKKGYIHSCKKFEQSTIWKRHTEGSYKLKPYAFRDGQSKVFSNFVKNSMPCMGIHVYHFILLNGYHVLLLLVDNTKSCKPRFKILDQLKLREWDDLANLDNALLTMTITNYNYACDKSYRKDMNSSINLCKIQSK